MRESFICTLALCVLLTGMVHCDQAKILPIPIDPPIPPIERSRKLNKDGQSSGYFISMTKTKLSYLSRH